MKRGTTRKQSTAEALVLERVMVTRSHRLELDRIRCVGCELCPAVCPAEAIEYVPGTIEGGKLVQRPTVDIDDQKCHFCGECVVVCPVNALSLVVDGQEQIPVWEYEVFPVLTKELTWDGTKLPKDKAHAVVEVCPTEVISVEVTRTKTGKVRRVKAVEVDESNCIYCKQCEVASPEAFAAIHPFEGIIRLNADLCPPEYQEACADVCPSHALVMEDGKLVLDDRFCLYCGACQLVCPVPEALIVKRHRVRHTPTKSGAWINAVEKLVSAELAAEEMELKSQTKRRGALKFLPGVPREK